MDTKIVLTRKNAKNWKTKLSLCWLCSNKKKNANNREKVEVLEVNIVLKWKKWKTKLEAWLPNSVPMKNKVGDLNANYILKKKKKIEWGKMKFTLFPFNFYSLLGTFSNHQVKKKFTSLLPLLRHHGHERNPPCQQVLAAMCRRHPSEPLPPSWHG